MSLKEKAVALFSMSEADEHRTFAKIYIITEIEQVPALYPFPFDNSLR